MTVLEVIEVIKTLALNHPDIAAFKTGTSSQIDDDVHEYPLVKLVHPIELSHKTDDSEPVTAAFKICVRVNSAEVDNNGVLETIEFNFDTENSTQNEATSPVALENNLRDRAFELATHLIAWIRMYIDEKVEYPSYLEIESATIKGVDRTNRDYVTGADIYLRLYLGDPYECEAKAIFNTYNP